MWAEKNFQFIINYTELTTHSLLKTYFSHNLNLPVSVNFKFSLSPKLESASVGTRRSLSHCLCFEKKTSHHVIPLVMGRGNCNPGVPSDLPRPHPKQTLSFTEGSGFFQGCDETDKSYVTFVIFLFVICFLFYIYTLCMFGGLFGGKESGMDIISYLSLHSVCKLASHRIICRTCFCYCSESYTALSTNTVNRY